MKINQDKKNALLIVVVLILTTGASFYLGNSLILGVVVLFVSLVILAQISENYRRTRRHLARIEKESQSITALYSVLKPINALPEFGGYALSADRACKLMEIVLHERPSIIVELGSGVSTLVSAYCLKSIGSGKVVSFDHDKEFIEVTRNNLKKHGLLDYVDIVYAPLVDMDVNGENYKWYEIDYTKIPGSVDLLFVDGPPGQTQPYARYPAMARFRKILSKDALVYLDDTNRDEEKEIIRRWVVDNANLEKDINYSGHDYFVGRLTEK